LGEKVLVNMGLRFAKNCPPFQKDNQKIKQGPYWMMGEGKEPVILKTVVDTGCKIKNKLTIKEKEQQSGKGK